jgi:hypothetical protein
MRRVDGASDTWTPLPGVELHLASLVRPELGVVATVFYCVESRVRPALYLRTDAELAEGRRRSGLALIVGQA